MSPAHANYRHNIAVLNLQWSSTGGVRTQEELAIFWIIVLNSIWAGLRYLPVREYAPLLCLWLAPLCSVVAHLM